MRKAFSILFLLIGFVFSSSNIFAQALDVSSVLKHTQDLMKKQKYEDAQKLLIRSLKVDRTSYRLWLALGYVFEATDSYEKALKALYRARDLKIGIPGLSTRIGRLEQIIKSQTSVAGLPKEKSEALALLQKARYKIKFNQEIEGFDLFIEAIEADRDLLAQDLEKIFQAGLTYFGKQNPKTPESSMYLGFLNFYIGEYKLAKSYLQSFVKENPEHKKIDMAKARLKEITSLLEAPAATKTTSKIKPIQKKPTTIIPQAAPSIARTNSAQTKIATVNSEEKPVSFKSKWVDPYEGMDPEQIYQEGLAEMESNPSKAISLISRTVDMKNPDPSKLMVLGDLYGKQKGSEKSAINLYRKIMQSYPSSQMAKEARSKIIQLNPANDQRAKEVREYFMKTGTQHLE